MTEFINEELTYENQQADNEFPQSAAFQDMLDQILTGQTDFTLESPKDTSQSKTASYYTGLYQNNEINTSEGDKYENIIEESRFPATNYISEENDLSYYLNINEKFQEDKNDLDNFHDQMPFNQENVVYGDENQKNINNNNNQVNNFYQQMEFGGQTSENNQRKQGFIFDANKSLCQNVDYFQQFIFGSNLFISQLGRSLQQNIEQTLLQNNQQQVGQLSEEQRRNILQKKMDRKEKVKQYLEKKKLRKNKEQSLRYPVRKMFADARIRIQGKFVSKKQATKILSENFNLKISSDFISSDDLGRIVNKINNSAKVKDFQQFVENIRIEKQSKITKNKDENSNSEQIFVEDILKLI